LGVPDLASGTFTFDARIVVLASRRSATVQTCSVGGETGALTPRNRESLGAGALRVSQALVLRR
jgi:hypothetical protein